MAFMKLLTIIVPAYNAESYLARCLDSLLPGGDEVEILVVDDGSTDATAELAGKYEKQYPTQVRLISQSNKGHGGAINTGIQYASGRYLKVVDSDDWLDTGAYQKVLEVLRALIANGTEPDLVIANYVYEKQGKRRKKVIHYRGIIPSNRIASWDEMGPLKKGRYILMHSVIYRTQLIKDVGLMLPEHTFYVDNLYVYFPLSAVKKFYYVDVDLYRYYIGRADQSVQEKNMIRRIDQQLRVNRLMLKTVLLEKVENPRLFWYLIHYFEIVTAVSSVMLVLGGAKEHFKKLRELWEDINQHNPLLYQYLRRSLVGRFFHLPMWIGRPLIIGVYRIAQGIFGFN